MSEKEIPNGFDTSQCKAWRAEYSALATRSRNEAEDARFKELTKLVRECDEYNASCEAFVNKAAYFSNN
ncbi:hypothetical protein K4K97_10640 [Phaeobacter inhibens]|uniref:hypothetical protein n=1 Tax=Phaeobacter inhibens TaxID=221822 RepID=UPI0021A334B1|nr:hypothetical protein [Phaeobacter inhibens]UWR79078.1 hypothetical protein K4K97_10640 [Phaeobacter inhibens]